jgi:two-component system sensor histidine kinase KdpD
VTIVRPDPEPLRPPARFRLDWRGLALAVVLTTLVTGLGKLVRAMSGGADAGLLYLLPVMVAATRSGLVTGIAAGLIASLAYNFFFVPPTMTFTIDDPRNVVSVGVLLGVAIASSQLAAQVRLQAIRAGHSARQSSLLAGYARHLTAIPDRASLGAMACREIGRLLDVNTVLVGRDGDGLRAEAGWPRAPELETLEVAAARWCFEHGRAAGRGSDTLTACEWLFQPIAAGGTVHAVFGLARADAGPALEPDMVPLLLSLLDQTGLALERIALAGEMAALAQVRERDRLRQALLSSVSHDLRTPLTAIIATLQAIEPASAEQATQLAGARGEAQRLHRFIANLLDMARIEAGALDGHEQAVDLAEAVASATHDLRAALAGRPLRIEIAADLPFVRADPHLLHHCLINLIDNAIKYGTPGTPITVAAAMEGDGEGEALALHVRDEGPGLPAGAEARVFERFARLEGSDRAGGTGLGLAIVKGFAEAMGLTVVAGNRADGQGADFAILVPRERSSMGSIGG